MLETFQHKFNKQIDEDITNMNLMLCFVSISIIRQNINCKQNIIINILIK